MSGEPCPECGGKGWIADGTAHGVVCVACADPVVLRAIADPNAGRKPGRRPLYDGRRPRAAPNPLPGGAGPKGTGWREGEALAREGVAEDWWASADRRNEARKAGVRAERRRRRDGTWFANRRNVQGDWTTSGGGRMVTGMSTNRTPTPRRTVVAIMRDECDCRACRTAAPCVCDAAAPCAHHADIHAECVAEGLVVR